MEARNPFDAAHQEGAAHAAHFVESLLRAGSLPPAEARLHGDNAFVWVEFLANTYPKVPAEANERDAWVFLFDYYVSQGPFSGPAVPLAPRSLEMFYDFLAAHTRVGEADFIRAACRQTEFYRHRVAGWAAIVQSADAPSSDPAEVDRAVFEWQDELARRMRPRGLVPDAEMARGEAPWHADMGPVEAAVFDAVCVVLSHRARALARSGVGADALERALVEEQDRFMRAPNRRLGMSPLAAVAAERKGWPDPETVSEE
jgi:hypothetical protein